jgi:hypothetical protein
MKRPGTLTRVASAVTVGVCVPACAAVLGVDDRILDLAAPQQDASSAVDTSPPPNDVVTPEVVPLDVGDTCATEQAAVVTVDGTTLAHGSPGPGGGAASGGEADDKGTT